jgi:hypothetical protein
MMGEWKRTFRLLMDEIVTSGLYNAANEIRCTILSEKNELTEFDRNYILYESLQPSSSLNTTHRKILGTYNRENKYNVTTKMSIVYIGKPEEYERPTLLHMKQSAEKTDHTGTKYFYIHTKGIRWYGTPREQCVIDWIKLMIYWNIEHWCNAIDVLNKYDTYGCNYNCSEHPPHYSGNFFWTTSYHLKILPDKIGPHYNAPEFWLCSNGMFSGKPNVYNAYNSDYSEYKYYENVGFGHYAILWPESNYRT